MSDLESDETSSEEQEFRTYPRPEPIEETFFGLTQYTWNWIYLLSFAILLGSFGMVVWLMWDVKTNMVTDVEIINGNVKRDELEILTEEERVAVLSGGISLQKSGNKLKIITSNVGLSAQKLSNGKVLGMNTGVISLSPGTGMDLVSTPVAKDVEGRATYAGTSYTLKATGVQTIRSVAVSKRDEEDERGVAPSTGIDVITTDQEVNILNTGVLTTTASTGLVNTGTSQDVVLKVTNPFIFVSTTIAYSDLASAGSKTLYTASSGTATYKILEIVTVSTGSTNFTGGDRIINIGTSSVQKWFISAAAAATVGTTSLVSTVSNTGIQPSAAVNAISDTAAGANIVAKYSGGATDYTAGLVNIMIVMVQTAY